MLTPSPVQVGVPGAFTGTCSAQIPAYIHAYAQFKQRGVDNIYVVAVNDAFVTKAWKDHLAPDGTRQSLSRPTRPLSLLTSCSCALYRRRPGRVHRRSRHAL